MLPVTSARLYGILDLGYVARMESAAVTARILAGGIDIIQLRAKNISPEEIEAIARSIHPLTGEAGVPLIINDHAEIAARIDAEGVHAGQDDPSVAEVREAVGNNSLIGKSTHSREQALAAAAEGADYIGFGPIFSTPTKPDYRPIGLDDIAWVHERVDIPIFCIGGIKKENVQTVIDAGAKRVVIVSGILHAGDIESYIQDVKAILTSSDL